MLQIEQAYHGTPFEIHASDRPFLDPRRFVRNEDEGDPEVAHIFATRDLVRAKLYASKDRNACAMSTTAQGFVVTYCSQPPDIDKEGFVYGLPLDGLEETKLRDDRGTGKLALTEERMPWVRDADGNWVRGVPVGEPIERVTIRKLIGEIGLRVFLLADDVERSVFCELSKDAKRASDGFDETGFLQDMTSRGWVRDITRQLLDGVVEVNFMTTVQRA